MIACVWPLIALAALLQAPAPPAPAVAEFTLPVGVRAALRYEPGSGAAAICVMVAAGAEADPEGSRVADLTTRCLFGDNLNLSKAAVRQAVYATGGDLSCTWNEQGVAISCVTTPDRFEDALYVIAQALKNAEMDAESVAAAKRTILASLRAEAANPDAVATAAAREALFPNSPYGRPRIEADAALRRLARADVLRCYQTWFRPERCSIAVVGDVTATRARRALENYLVDFERQPVPRSFVAEAKPSSDPARRAITMRSGTRLVMTLLPAPPPASDDFPAALTLTALLGGGKGSRMFRELREAEGIGYALGAECRWQAAGNQIVASVEAPPAEAARAEEILDGVVAGLVARPPGEAELERARRFASGAYRLAHERVSDRARHLAVWAGTTLGASADGALGARIAKVTAEDVVRVARAAQGHRARVVVGPPQP
ncbi:MAG: pitrilysin family protein [Armatimonadetes bacterium]|nr:pitrilysin family protein [Armatimonadota bacterium]